MNDFIPGLIITAIGMGLVFICIIFLWGLMALMVRLDGKALSENEEIPDSPTGDGIKLQDSRIHKAAAAAMAVALALKEKQKLPSRPENPEQSSSWQSVQRAQVLQEKSRIYAHRQSRRS